MTTTECPFCDKKQKYRYIAESNLARILYPKAPACKYHVLIVPKRHVPALDELTDAEVVEIHFLLKQLTTKAKSFTGFLGYNTLSNNGGPAVRQHVMHSHTHVFIRMADEVENPLVPVDSATPPALTDTDMHNIKVLQALFNAPNAILKNR